MIALLVLSDHFCGSAIAQQKHDPTTRPQQTRGRADGPAQRDNAEIGPQNRKQPRNADDSKPAGDPERRRAAAHDRSAGDDGDDPLDLRRAGMPGLDGFGPAQQDRGPLAVGEADALISFTQEHVPLLHRILTQVREQKPQEFSRKLSEFAPRLRFLKRLHEQNPELAQKVIKIAENLQRMKRLRRAWNDVAQDQKRRIIRQARPLFAENLEAEKAVLTERISNLRDHRRQRIESEFNRLTQPGADLADETAEVREIIDSRRSDVGDARLELDTQLREIIAGGNDDAIAGLEDRLQHLNANAPREVERRLRAMFPHNEAGLPPPSRERSADPGAPDRPGRP